MSVKDFKIKSGLVIGSLSAAGVITTDSSGNISSSAALAISQGGTGQTTANNALNALLPVQDGGTVNYTIQSDGTSVSWTKLYNQLIKDAGVSVTPRRNINFVNAVITDSAGTDTTTITIPITPLNSYSRESFIATSGQTSFTLSNASIIGYEQVFLNGIHLVKTVDYTTPTSTTVVLTEGASASDHVEIMVLTDITSSATYYQVLKENGTTKTSRANLNIIGATLTDDYANDQTTITIDQPLKASSFMLMGA
jgi:hypothetical protein